MRIPRSVHAVVRAILILLILSCPALPASESDQASTEQSSSSLLLLFSDISEANVSELRSRAASLGLNEEGTAEQLRIRLYGWYGIVPSDYDAVAPNIEDRDEVVIESADRIYVQGSGTRFILLEGNVVLRLYPEGSTHEVSLQASRIAVDLKRRMASAIGQVRHESSDGESRDVLEGSILSFDWQEDRLVLSEGSSSLTRTNSEGDAIRFYTLGSSLSIAPGGKVVSYENGMITTNREQAYFSVRAKSLHMIDGGDLFATSASIFLGRVPMLWVPFFYYPGRTFVFNPAFGFDSQRGVFFSSTTELYGRYPKIDPGEVSSFTSLLASGSSGERHRDGWVYASGDRDLSSFETWARESESYLAVLFDAYRNRGVFMGLDTVNNLFSDHLSITSFGGVAFPGEASALLSPVYDIGSVRYGIQGSTEVDSKHVNLALRMSMYSDPRFLRDYGNRLTAFSLGALGGTATFPQDYRSDITSFDWILSARASIPTSTVSPFISSLQLERLNARVSWKALTKAEGSGYQVSSVTLPDLGVLVSGTILDLKGNTASDKTSVHAAQIPLDPAIIFDDWGISGPYSPSTPTAAPSKTTIDSSSLRIDYSARQSYTENISFANQVAGVGTSYARTAGSLSIKGALAPTILTIAQRFEPLVTVNSSENSLDQQVTVMSLSDVSIPRAGLTYGLSMRLFQNRMTETTGSPPVESGGWLPWDTDSVSRHQVSWRKPFALGMATITPSLTATITPIPFSLTPKLEYAHGRFFASASYKFADDGTGTLAGDDAILRLSYLDRKVIEFASTATYRSGITGGLLDPLLLDMSLTAYPFDAFLSFAGKGAYDFDVRKFEQFSVSASIPWARATVHGSGPVEAPVVDLLDTAIVIDAFERRWWKNRLSFGLDLEASYRHAFWDPAASSFMFKISSAFSIAEFLSLDIGLTTVNKGFHRYGSFSDMWEDLLRSFDFFGNGRRSTQFTMESVEVSLVHHMADWDLHCKYQGSVVLSDLEWRWNPVLSVFLQWKAIPEIKVDRQFDI